MPDPFASPAAQSTNTDHPAVTEPQPSRRKPIWNRHEHGPTQDLNPAPVLLVRAPTLEEPSDGPEREQSPTERHNAWDIAQRGRHLPAARSAVETNPAIP